jgi:hypothetical protein
MSPLILHGRTKPDWTQSTTEQPHEVANDVLARWEVARQQLRELDPALIPQGHALRVLVEQDFPKVIEKLERSRQN